MSKVVIFLIYDESEIKYGIFNPKNANGFK